MFQTAATEVQRLITPQGAQVGPANLQILPLREAAALTARAAAAEVGQQPVRRAQPVREARVLNGIALTAQAAVEVAAMRLSTMCPE